MDVTDDKIIVKNYFNSTGFDRWKRIYGDGNINKVQLDIRNGHQQTIDEVLDWLKEDGNLTQISVCDAGCGVGSLSIPLATAGAKVHASDISEKMVEEGKARALYTLGNNDNPTFAVQELEAISGSYHTVICLDVLIHYSQEKMEKMISHLCSVAQTRIILSFAPKTFFLTILKKIGSLFPGPSKTTRAYMHKEIDMIDVLKKNGFTLQRNSMIRTRFYFSRLLEATKD
ncbi:Mg-protoporphyrin O-methyltransferase [Richelia intracellularis HH01]|jgi:magnesium-protoporphyrin O-methyltransferase|uniref:Magnesium protoporphyrin IX methyltransferase n=1 Tax=Richelia intracellularis HH01 TaxID=1165094 RepID=M1WZC6_9NOST|nr:magnesium protoporphyrin IX methyltransferase [Richelia intracellularis]CCH67477.1 Mg-protoporphyrin O-methyltransferase [Richelia intracellularis HH01]